MKFLENRIPPPLVALAFGVAMWGVSKWITPLSISSRVRVTVAIVIGAIAFSTALSAFVVFWRAGTTVDPVRVEKASAIVTGGVFRVTRNPMYVSLTLLLIAWAILLAVPWNLIGPVLFAIYIQRFQIRPEERAMEAKFGADYLAYKQRVRRWL